MSDQRKADTKMPPAQQTQSNAAGQQNCAVCGKAITKTPIKRMGNFHCSVYCAEQGRERMENLDLEKIDFAALGPVVDRFMSTCQECPLVLKCREVRPFCGAYFEELHDDISMRWCCHAIYALSCMLSDGSVTRDVVQKVIKKAEEIARGRGNAGVSTVTLAMATGELMEDFSYAPYPDVPPPPPAEEHDHYLACVQCDKKFMDECLRETEEAEKNLLQVEAQLDFPYCGHMRYEMSSMLLNPTVDMGKIKKLINKSRMVMKEKQYKGGHFRIHYLALGRSIKNK